MAWPDSRKTIELGVISITRLIPDAPVADKKLLFIPNAVPAGIEPADPMIQIRSMAYPVSFGRRQ
ncbi:Catalase [compost metagenome]